MLRQIWRTVRRVCHQPFDAATIATLCRLRRKRDVNPLPTVPRASCSSQPGIGRNRTKSRHESVADSGNDSGDRTGWSGTGGPQTVTQSAHLAIAPVGTRRPLDARLPAADWPTANRAERCDWSTAECRAVIGQDGGRREGDRRATGDHRGWGGGGREPSSPEAGIGFRRRHPRSPRDVTMPHTGKFTCILE